MRRLLTGLGGALGLAWLWSRLNKPQSATPATRADAGTDPVTELRAKLEQARGTEDDRDEFDAAEGQPVNEVGDPRSIEERRRAIHEQAQRALGEMRRLDGE